MSAEILSQIEDVLDQIRPALHADGGDVELMEFDEEGFVHLSMQGSCGGCPMSTATLTLGIEAELRRNIREVEGVITGDGGRGRHPPGTRAGATTTGRPTRDHRGARI